MYGFPHLFITLTCNTKWSEIIYAFNDVVGPSAEDKPKIVSRVFRVKVRALKDDIKKEQNFCFLGC